MPTCRTPKVIRPSLKMLNSKMARVMGSNRKLLGENAEDL
jgi:hypothetical protein